MPTFTTEISGLGEVPLGTTALGMPLEVVTESQAATDGVRFLDPVTRDYAERDGELLLAGSARQRIIILLTTEVRTSLSVKGIRFPDLHDDSTARAVESDVRRTLQPLVDDGSIALQRVVVRTRAENIVGRLGVSVEYIDLQINEEDSVDA